LEDQVLSIPFDPDSVRRLAEILTETGLTEIEIEAEGARVRLVRAPAQVIATASAPVAAAPISVATTPAAPAAPVIVDLAKHPGVVLSPMVGVAYLAPEPGAAPFITIGQSVAAGQTLLLIEAMKTFNQIKAPASGIVTRILISPGSPVEYGEPLLIVE
jgi:acetyl-CoA carboxylase biotin carboxyl carrier protein